MAVAEQVVQSASALLGIGEEDDTEETQEQIDEKAKLLAQEDEKVDEEKEGEEGAEEGEEREEKEQRFKSVPYKKFRQTNERMKNAETTLKNLEWAANVEKLAAENPQAAVDYMAQLTAGFAKKNKLKINLGESRQDTNVDDEELDDSELSVADRKALTKIRQLEDQIAEMQQGLNTVHSGVQASQQQQTSDLLDAEMDRLADKYNLDDEAVVAILDLMDKEDIRDPEIAAKAILYGSAEDRGKKSANESLNTRRSRSMLNGRGGGRQAAARPVNSIGDAAKAALAEVRSASKALGIR